MDALLAALAALLFAAPRSGEPAPTAEPPPAAPAPAWILCTPTSLLVQGRPARPSEHPIARALEEARPGTVVWVDPGDYPPLRIGFTGGKGNARTSGGRPGAPIVVQGRGRARIVGQGDAISISQDVPNGYITFRDLEIRPGERSGVCFFERGDGRTHRGYRFEDCDVLGGFDHRTGRGPKTKWGIWANGLDDFAFVGVRRPARVADIRFEHGFYLQNPQGPVLIENVEGARLGRTFVQLTGRRRDGPEGRGDVTVRGCRVEDCGLSARDAFKGGCAFTVAGGLSGRLVFERNRYRAGFDPSLTKLTRGTAPYGTGAFVAWAEGGERPNGTLVLRDNDFELAEGCGDRPVVSIGGCREVRIEGANRFASGGVQPALALDPRDERGKRISPANGEVVLGPGTRLEGALERDGARASGGEPGRKRK